MRKEFQDETYDDVCALNHFFRTGKPVIKENNERGVNTGVIPTMLQGE